MTKFCYIFFIVFMFFLDARTTIAMTNNNYCQYKHEILVQNKTSGDSTTEDYPVVDQIETRILGKSSPNEDIYKRLDSLETKIFGTVSKKDLTDRVDDLSKAVLNDNNNSGDGNYKSSDNSSDQSSSLPPSYSSSSNGLSDLVNQLESQLLKQTYPNDPIESRLSRLEKFVFNQSSDEYPTQERIDRLAAVVKAQPSNQLYKDTAQLQKLQTAGQGLAIVALILMIVAGLAF